MCFFQSCDSIIFAFFHPNTVTTVSVKIKDTPVIVNTVKSFKKYIFTFPEANVSEKLTSMMLKHLLRLCNAVAKGF